MGEHQVMTSTPVEKGGGDAEPPGAKTGKEPVPSPRLGGGAEPKDHGRTDDDPSQESGPETARGEGRPVGGA